MNYLFTIFCVLLFGVHSHTLQAQYSEVGWANYYSDYYQGRPTAYGEAYDRAQLTCAHRTYGQGTLLRVTRLDNGASVVARVNDKGPFTEGFVVSLSYAGAMMIGLEQVGKARVKVDVVGFANENQYLRTPPVEAPADYNTFTARTPASTSKEPLATTPPKTQVNLAMPTSKDLIPKSAYSESYVVPKEYSAVPQRTNTSPQSYYTSAESTQTYSPVPPSTARTSANYPPPSEYTYTAPSSTNTFTARGYNPGTTSATPQEYNLSSTSSAVAAQIKRIQPGSGLFGIQVGSYGNLDNAERQAQALLNQGLPSVSILQVYSGNSPIYRLIVGSFAARTDAENYLQQIRSQFLVSGFVARI